MRTQTELEMLFNRKQLHSIIQEELESMEDWDEIMEQSRGLVYDYIYKTYDYQSKNTRMSYLSDLDIDDLITKIYISTTLSQETIPLITAATITSGVLKMEEKEDSILTICELLAVLRPVGMYKLHQLARGTAMQLTSCITLDNITYDEIEMFMYLPPMVEPPRKLHNNRDSAYYTLYTDSVILRHQFNHHSNDVCLDVLNKQNKNKYRIDPWFCNNFKQEFEADVLDPKDREIAVTAFDKMLNQTAMLLPDLIDRTIYITNKWDKRGRMYAQGYHITTQGSEYKKCMVDLEASCVIDIPI